MLGCLLAVFGPVDAATPSPVALVEIAHLLAYVASSGCQFNRNGTWHDSRSAHLAKKERYRQDRGQIASAEDFIARAATKSSMTRRPYSVRCASGPVVASSQRLEAELTRFRMAEAAHRN